jgi:hypothetical protein
VSDAGLTYVYCVARAARSPRIGRVRGVPDTGAPRVLDGGGLRLLVATARRARYDGDALAAALRDVAWVSAAAVAHDRVIGRWLGADAVVPLRPFTLFADDERALAWARRRRRALDRLLDRVDGCVEVGVRVAVASSARSARAGASSANGTDFLRRKLGARDAARAQLERASAGADRVFDALAAHARVAVEQPLAAGGLLLDAAYLVPIRQLPKFRSRIAALERTARGDGMRIAVTGPWPPYNFVREAR